MLKRIAYIIGIALVFGLGYFLGGYQVLDSIPPRAHAIFGDIETIACPPYSVSCIKDMSSRYVKITFQNATVTSFNSTGNVARVYYINN